MKIRDIKDARVQQMAIINAINERPELHLEDIMNYLLNKAFIWAATPQGSRFWKSVIEMKPFKYSEFGLFFKSTQGIFKQQVDELEFRCANDLATPEEVYKHLKQKDVENKPKQEPMCNDWEAYGVQLEQEVKDLKFKIANLEANKDWLTSQNEKLNKLVDEIEEELTKRAGNVFYPQIDLIELIQNYRNQSIINTTQTVEHEQELKELKSTNVFQLEAICELSKKVCKLNLLVGEIERALSRELLTPSRFYNVAYDLIKDYRNPSLVGTTQEVEIKGKKYRVKVEGEAKGED